MEILSLGKKWNAQDGYSKIHLTEEVVQAAIVRHAGVGEEDGFVLADAKFGEWILQNPSRLPEVLRTKQGRYYIRLGTRMVATDGQVRLLALHCDGHHIRKLVVDQDVHEGRVPIYEILLPAALAA